MAHEILKSGEFKITDFGLDAMIFSSTNLIGALSSDEILSAYNKRRPDEQVLFTENDVKALIEYLQSKLKEFS